MSGRKRLSNDGHRFGGFSWTPVVLALLAFELGLTVLLVRGPNEIAIVICGLIIGCGILAVSHLALRAPERAPVLALTSAALLIRVTTLLLVHYGAASPGNPHGLLYPDSFGYDRTGWHLAEHWRHGTSPRLEYQTTGLTLGYHFFVAAIYAVVGHVPLFPKMVNVLLGVAMVPLTFLLTRGVSSSEARGMAGRGADRGSALAGGGPALIAALLMAVWPPLVFWSVQLIKDTLIAFLLLVGVLGWMAFARRPRLLPLAVAVVPALPLAFLRAYLCVFWMIGVTAGLVLLAVGRRRPMLAVVSMLVAGGVAWWASGDYLGLRGRDLSFFIGKLSAIGTGPGSMFEGVVYRTPRDLVTFLPLGIARFFLSPLPWKLGALRDSPEATGSILRYFMLPFAAVGLVHLIRREKAAVIPIVLCGALTIALYALAFRGGIPRHLVQFYPYLFAWAAIGSSRFRGWPLPMAVGCWAFMTLFLAVSTEEPLLLVAAVELSVLVFLFEIGVRRKRDAASIAGGR